MLEALLATSSCRKWRLLPSGNSSIHCPVSVVRSRYAQEWIEAYPEATSYGEDPRLRKRAVLVGQGWGQQSPSCFGAAGEHVPHLGLATWEVPLFCRSRARTPRKLPLHILCPAVHSCWQRARGCRRCVRTSSTSGVWGRATRRQLSGWGSLRSRGSTAKQIPSLESPSSTRSATAPRRAQAWTVCRLLPGPPWFTQICAQVLGSCNIALLSALHCRFSSAIPHRGL